MDNQNHQKPLSNPELAEFCNQMGMILHSGISALEGLSLLAEDAQTEAEKSLLSKMMEHREYTGSLYEATFSTGVFPTYALHMIKLGEETGNLDDIMTSLGQHYTREANFAAMIRSSLTYPFIMLGMMLLIIVVLLTKVMPVFQQVFAQLGQEMTGFSAGLLRIGELLSRYSIVFLAIVVVVVMLLAFGRKYLPFQRKIRENIASCRFCEGMSIALKSGITPEESLALTTDLIEYDAFQQKIKKCAALVDDGSNIAEAFHQSEILSGTYARMASLGEKTGTLDEALSHIASEYEYTLNTKITGRIAMIEPTLVIVLSLIVGTILFSVMLPLLGIMTGI